MANMAFMSCTLDTSHSEILQSNKSTRKNRRLMLVIFDTSHSLIGPCAPSEQQLSGGSSIHASIAALSSDFNSGENQWRRADGVVTRSGFRPLQIFFIADALAPPVLNGPRPRRERTGVRDWLRSKIRSKFPCSLSQKNTSGTKSNVIGRVVTPFLFS